MPWGSGRWGDVFSDRFPIWWTRVPVGHGPAAIGAIGTAGRGAAAPARAARREVGSRASHLVVVRAALHGPYRTVILRRSAPT